MQHSLASRPARPVDAAAIAAIYNQGIADRSATFETEPRTPEQIAAWFAAAFPIVVVENSAGEIVAWASTSRYRERPCYAGIAEFSVYVARAGRGQGAGRVALQALIAAADAKGFWKLVSRVFVANAASRALCKSVGFREVGTYVRHARLDGIWRDVVIVERLLGKASDPVE